MKWIKVMDEDTLDEGDREVVTVADHKILILKNSGELYAVLNSCPHMGVPLKRGKLEDDNIVCPLHRSVFALETGEVKEWAPWPPVVGPMMGAIKEERKLPVYPTKIEEGAVFIGVEDEE